MKDGHKSSTKLGTYLGNTIYGALDGTVTTFAIMAGAVGAQLSTQIIIILGAANLFADGFSMAVSNYLSEISKKEYLDRSIKDTQASIKHNPAAAKAEILEKYQHKGFRGQDLDRAVNIITSHPQRWLKELVSYEGLIDHSPPPILTSLVTFTSFIVIGFMPLAPLLLLQSVSFWSMILFVSIILFVVGSLRSMITTVSWWRGGLEIMVSGISASLIAYFIGNRLNSIFSP